MMNQSKTRLPILMRARTAPAVLSAIFSPIVKTPSLSRRPSLENADIDVDHGQSRVAAERPPLHACRHFNRVRLPDRDRLRKVNVVPDFLRRSSVQRRMASDLVVPMLVVVEPSLHSRPSATHGPASSRLRSAVSVTAWSRWIPWRQEGRQEYSPRRAQRSAESEDPV